MSSSFTVQITAAERTNGRPTPSTRSSVYSHLQQYGVCILSDLIPSHIATTNYNQCLSEWNYIQAAQAPLSELYEGHLQNTVPRYAELAPRGPRRYSISTFQSPTLRNNPMLHTLMETALQPGGPSSCWSEETVISLPGAAEQRIHVDAGHLYDPHLTSSHLPCYHYSCFIALCDQTPLTGNTAFALGTHATHGGGWESTAHWEFPAATAFVDAYLKAGSCVIFDSRLYHRGRANTSNQVRPIYGLMYANSWFNSGTSYFGTTSLIQEREKGHLISWAEAACALKKEHEGTHAHKDIDFVALHASQLTHISVPNCLWNCVAQKMRDRNSIVIDAHRTFSLGIVAGEGDGRILDIVANRKVRAFEDIFIVEHAWTWQEGGLSSARVALSKRESAESGTNQNRLLHAVWGTTLPMRNWKEGVDVEESQIECVMQRVQNVYQSYAVGGEEGAATWCYFVPDLLGCHLQEVGGGSGEKAQKDPNVCLSPAFVDVRTGVACSFLFPIRDIAEGEVVRIPTGSRASLAPKV